MVLPPSFFDISYLGVQENIFIFASLIVVYFLRMKYDAFRQSPHL